MEFTIHNKETAPEASKDLLDQVSQKFGFVPNLLAGLAESPQTAQAYLSLSHLFNSTSLTAQEQNIVSLVASKLNRCHYCTAAHSTISKSIGVDEKVITSLRDDLSLSNQKLEALRQFTEKLVVNRGQVEESEINEFIQAGYTKAQVLEIILGISMKVISNYANQVMKTPIDTAFQNSPWKIQNSAS